MIITANNPNRKSWLKVEADSDFPIQNIPFGVFITRDDIITIGSRIGDYAIDLGAFHQLGYFDGIPLTDDMFLQDNLNDFIADGRKTWRLVRNRIAEVFDVKNGILIPECSSTPADANKSTKYANINSVPPSAVMVSDFATKPLNNGNAAIDMAPIMQQIMVNGICLYKPPSSDALAVPVWNITVPTDINNNDLYMICTKACATAPFNASGVPIPTATTINPSWLLRLNDNTRRRSFSITAKTCP